MCLTSKNRARLCLERSIFCPSDARPVGELTERSSDDRTSSGPLVAVFRHESCSRNTVTFDSDDSFAALTVLASNRATDVKKRRKRGRQMLNTGANNANAASTAREPRLWGTPARHPAWLRKSLSCKNLMLVRTIVSAQVSTRQPPTVPMSPVAEQKLSILRKVLWALTLQRRIGIRRRPVQQSAQGAGFFDTIFCVK